MSYPHPECNRCRELEAEYKTLEVLYKVACARAEKANQETKQLRIKLETANNALVYSNFI